MKQVASGAEPPYYFDATDAASLQSAFNQIATHLSKLRLSK
jgi:orotate phosphoribosyltransferase